MKSLLLSGALLVTSLIHTGQATPQFERGSAGFLLVLCTPDLGCTAGCQECNSINQPGFFPLGFSRADLPSRLPNNIKTVSFKKDAVRYSPPFGLSRNRCCTQFCSKGEPVGELICKNRKILADPVLRVDGVAISCTAQTPRCQVATGFKNGRSTQRRVFQGDAQRDMNNARRSGAS